MKSEDYFVKLLHTVQIAHLTKIYYLNQTKFSLYSCYELNI
jgi:hypothetical protein